MTRMHVSNYYDIDPGQHDQNLSEFKQPIGNPFEPVFLVFDKETNAAENKLSAAKNECSIEKELESDSDVDLARTWFRWVVRRTCLFCINERYLNWYEVIFIAHYARIRIHVKSKAEYTKENCPEPRKKYQNQRKVSDLLIITIVGHK